MRVASFTSNGREGYGLVEGDAVQELTGWRGHATLGSILEAAELSDLRGDPTARRLPLSQIKLLPPISAQCAVWCVGVNYADRGEEYGDGIPAPAYPSLFFRLPRSFTGHGQPLVRPRVSHQLDYEGEIALIIGWGGRHIATEQALNHVAALTLANEGSVRDWLRHSKFNVTQGKNFDRSGSIGPWIVTPDELDPASIFRLTTRVNGEIRQDDTTDRMIFSFARLIAYFSTFATLQPGDVILTGTPAGAGARFTPPLWLKPGDSVEVSVTGIGTLRNGVIDEMPIGGGGK